MLTKKFKFDSDVLDIIKTMEWQDGGKLGLLTCGQLERQLYQKVNKALAAMGGKWNRKAGGHIFKVDPRAQVEGLLEDGELVVERDGFFETPDPVIDRMFELAPPVQGLTYLEPSAGMGAIARRLIDEIGQHIRLYCIEKNEQRRRYLKEAEIGYVFDCDDFLTWGGSRPTFDRVYMNPPFEEMQDIDHVRHAYNLVVQGGVLVSVMGEGPFFREDRKAREFREWLDEVGGSNEKLPEDSFKASGTGVAARLVMIRK